VEARLENGTDWHIADLRGTGTEKIDGRSVLLRPKQILTLAAGLL